MTLPENADFTTTNTSQESSKENAACLHCSIENRKQQDHNFTALFQNKEPETMLLFTLSKFA